MRTNKRHRDSGFSLIEVLVSVVVMSFGLLALAALQSALFKAGAESRAQSAALALATEKIEYFEGFLDRPEFQAIATGADGSAIEIDGIAYTRSWTVERYAYPKDAASGAPFESVGVTGELSDDYITNNEFKRVQVNVAWVDATGAAQQVSLETALAGLSPQDTARIAKVASTGGVRGPEIIIKNPASEEGVIPIAVGDGTDTAATNPRPEVAGKNNSQRVIETRFDVLTYAALSGNEALAQSRVETIVAGCTCDYGRAPGGVGKRPTYWNGQRYVVPKDSTVAAPAGAANVDVQSAHCDVCCRDHHDPAGVSGARFDPRRASHEQHQLFDAESGTLGSPTSSGQYTESCRLIRVDGIFRVAADMYNDYMNLLATDNGASDTVSDYVPTAAATANYQNFVLQYLEDKFVDGNAGSYNTVIDPAGGAVASLEATYSINEPTTAIPIARPSQVDGASSLKWLHNRGLYIDYLEDEALQAVNEAKQDCSAADGSQPSAAQLRTCVLTVLPFTTINLTELANWTPAVGDQIVVSNNDFRTSLTSDVPVRGKVVPGSKPTPNTTTDALATMRKSNSGVAVMRGAIDTDDLAAHADAQPFKPDGSWSGADNDAGSGGTFAIRLDNYEFLNVAPTFSVAPVATCNPATSGLTQPNPFTCTTQYAGDQMGVTIANYNYQINRASSAAVTCYDSNGGDPVTYPGGSYTEKVCRNYAVSGITKNDTSIATTYSIANQGSVHETTTVSPMTIAQGDVIGITFGAPVDTTQPVTCSYKGNGNNLNQFTLEVADCP